MMRLWKQQLVSFIVVIRSRSATKHIFALKLGLDFFSPLSLWSYLLLSPGHISWLLCVERIGDATHHKYIKLEPFFLLLLLSLHLLHVLLLFVATHRRAGAGGSATAAPAHPRLEPSAAVAVGDSARRQPGSSEALRGRHLFVLHLQYLISFFLAGRRVQHDAARMETSPVAKVKL